MLVTALGHTHTHMHSPMPVLCALEALLPEFFFHTGLPGRQGWMRFWLFRAFIKAC